MKPSPNPPEGTTQVKEWLASPAHEYANAAASDYLERRWAKSRVTQWDHQVTRRTVLEELDPQPSDRILEIGCGPGTWTQEIAPLCQEVVAVDILEKMIAEAQKNTQGLPVRFIHSDFLHAPLEGTWDKIISVRAIEYMPDRKLLAQKIAQALSPGGTVVLITKTRFSVWRGRMRLLYRSVPWSSNHRQNGTDGGANRAKVRQYLASPGDLAAAFAPYEIVPTAIRPVVVRPPIFRRGFHEIPLIPETLASPLLGLSGLVYEAGLHAHRNLTWLPLLLSESYCITLKHVGRDGEEAGQINSGKQGPGGV